MSKEIELNKIIHFLGNEIKSIYGNPENIKISYLRDLQNVDKFTLDWVNPLREDNQKIVENSKARVIITGEDIEYSEILREQNKVIIQVDNPKLAVAKVGNAFLVKQRKSGIHSTAIVNKKAEIGRNVFIGPHTTIGKCQIGDNVTIHSNVTLYDHTVVKNNVVIHAGAVIGVDGLGCERERSGRLVKFPHFGKVIIEDDVEIGANCQIAKGALSDTIIGQGTKINGGSYIAHNVVVGENVWISPEVNIAGSVKILNNVTIYSGAIIREQRMIGEGAIIGMGAVVTKNVPDGEVWVGNPARELKVKK